MFRRQKAKEMTKRQLIDRAKQWIEDNEWTYYNSLAECDCDNFLAARNLLEFLETLVIAEEKTTHKRGKRND